MTKRLITLLSLVGMFFLSCQNKQEIDEKRERLLEIISESESAIKNQILESKQPDTKLALEAVEAYRNFIYHYSKDSLAPVYHFKMARLFDGVLEDKNQAIIEYDRMYQTYADFKDRPILLFFEGSAFHDLGDTTNAIQTLRLFLEKYPDHDFADDAQGLIQIIRMDPGEFQERFLLDQDSAA